MSAYLPLHLAPVDRCPTLEPWLRQWMGNQAKVLTPMDWFEQGHDIVDWTLSADGFWRPVLESGTYIWQPPPAAALFAITELRKARIKRQDSTHVFVCPRLMTPEWLRSLYKEADFVFVVPLNSPFWNESMYEPLYIGVCFPFLSSFPWQIRGTPKMSASSRQLQGMWETAGMDTGPFLCKLLRKMRSLVSVQERVVRQVLYIKE